jgi:hypothetical protein
LHSVVGLVSAYGIVWPLTGSVTVATRPFGHIS